MILGGSSMHYGAQAFPPFPADYGNWVTATGVDWTIGNLKEAADEVRQVFNVHSDPEEILSEGQRSFRHAARSLGYQVRPLEGAKKNCLRSGFCNAANMCKYDAKMSALLTHVPDAEEHGVEIIPNTMVKKVLFDGRKATGVMCRQEDRETLIAFADAAPKSSMISCNRASLTSFGGQVRGSFSFASSFSWSFRVLPQHAAMN